MLRQAQHERVNWLFSAHSSFKVPSKTTKCSRLCGHFAVIPVKTGIHLHTVPNRATTRRGERPHTQLASLSIAFLATLRSKLRDNPLQTLETPRLRRSQRTLFDTCARNDTECPRSLASRQNSLVSSHELPCGCRSSLLLFPYNRKVKLQADFVHDAEDYSHAGLLHGELVERNHGLGRAR